MLASLTGKTSRKPADLALEDPRQLAEAEVALLEAERQIAARDQELSRREFAALSAAGAARQSLEELSRSRAGAVARDFLSRTAPMAALTPVPSPEAQRALSARRDAITARRDALAAEERRLAAFEAHTAGMTESLDALRRGIAEVQRRASTAAEVEKAAAHAVAQIVLAPKPAPRRTAAARQTARVALETEVGLSSDSNFFCGFSADLSTGGIFIATYTLVQPGAEVEVAFALPEGPVRARGIVRWSREHNDRTPEIFPGIGVSFTEIAPQALAAIERFVATREPMFFPESASA